MEAPCHIHAMLVFATFDIDSNSNYEEVKERLSKFFQFFELTTVENNSIFKLVDSNLFEQLLKQSELIYDSYQT